MARGQIEIYLDIEHDEKTVSVQQQRGYKTYMTVMQRVGGNALVILDKDEREELIEALIAMREMDHA